MGWAVSEMVPKAYCAQSSPGEQPPPLLGERPTKHPAQVMGMTPFLAYVAAPFPAETRFKGEPRKSALYPFFMPLSVTPFVWDWLSLPRSLH